MRKPFRVTDDMRSGDVLKAAFSYAEAGVSVLALWGIEEDGRCGCGVPSCVKAGKHPITRLFPKGFKSATLDKSKIERAWRLYPEANIGIVPIGNLVVLDIDGPVGEEAIAQLALPETASVRSSRGRRHLYFTDGSGQLIPKLPQVDRRQNQNGYLVAPPSYHASGGQYRWAKKCSEAAALPRLELEAPNRKIKLDFAADAKSALEGGRNTKLTSIAGALRHVGLSEKAIRAGLDGINRVVCSPPLDADEVRRISHSVGQYPTPSQDAFGCIADVVEEDVSWLFKPYIPRGTLTMLEGNPGLGKSSFTVALAAAVTTGAPLPWSSDTSRGTVLIQSAEDDPARVLKPRLGSNGADHQRVRYQREIFSLDEVGVAKLRLEIEAERPDLVIIDPVIAFLGSGADLNDAADMTRFLTQLDSLAREFDCAILLVRHLRKTKDNSSITQGLGSIALSGRVRSILLLGRHPGDASQRAVVHVKSNYSAEGPAILFSMAQQAGHPQIMWEGTDESISAQDLMNTDGHGVGRPAKEGHNAIEFLREFLRDGEMDSKKVLRAAETRSVTEITLRRAAKQVGIIMRKQGRSSFWALPPMSQNHSADIMAAD